MAAFITAALAAIGCRHWLFHCAEYADCHADGWIILMLCRWADIVGRQPQADKMWCRLPDTARYRPASWPAPLPDFRHYSFRHASCRQSHYYRPIRQSWLPGWPAAAILILIFTPAAIFAWCLSQLSSHSFCHWDIVSLQILKIVLASWASWRP